MARTVSQVDANRALRTGPVLRSSNVKPASRGLLGFFEVDWTAMGIVGSARRGSKRHNAARHKTPHRSAEAIRARELRCNRAATSQGLRPDRAATFATTLR